MPNGAVMCRKKSAISVKGELVLSQRPRKDLTFVKILIWQKEYGIDAITKKPRLNRRKDYTGLRFGHLVVDEMLYDYGNAGEAYCKCTCDCGNTIIQSAYSIRHKRNPPHCGCMTAEYKTAQNERARVDLTGRRFGRAVVTGMIYETGKPTRARCKCDCGSEFETVATYLTSGETKSCGCYHRERTAEANTKDFTGVVSDYGVRFLSRSCKNESGQWLWNCKCGECGTEFVALPAKVLSGHITSCGCARRSSRERLIDAFLNELGIEYVAEYRFEDCVDINALPFDFYLPRYNTVIEYQGAQHYKSVDMFGGEDAFETRRKHDAIKRDYCKTHNISLLELPYSLNDEEIKSAITNVIYP